MVYRGDSYEGSLIVSGQRIVKYSIKIVSILRPLDYVFTSRITHRFWATHRKVLDKNRLDLMASRLRSRQSNRKREIETRCHLSR